MDKKIAEGIVGRARHLLEPADLQKMSVEELVDKASMAMLYCHRTSVQDQSMRASLELARRNKLLEKALMTAVDAIKSTDEDTFGSVDPVNPNEEGYWIRDELTHRLCKALKQNRGE